MKTRLLIIIPVIIVISILAVFIIDSVNLDRLCSDSGGKRNSDICIIQSTQESSEDISEQIESVNFDNIFTMKPDSEKLFYYPNPEDTENRDHFQLFMIIRLPEWLGGDINDVSAYRVYSTQSVDDQCMVKYWPGEDRQRIENPCRGGFYRVHDGAMTVTFGSVPGSPPIALPYLELSNDKDGFLYIEPPSFTTTENGVIGVGKEITPKEIARGSQFYLNAFSKAYPEYPELPLYFSSMTLAEIIPSNYGVTALYSEFTPTSQNIKISLTNCNCENVRGNYSEDTLETINGTILVIHEAEYRSIFWRSIKTR